MSDEYLNRVKRVLGPHNIQYWFEQRRRHRQVVVAHRGRNFVFTFPGSGSDIKGPRNLEASMRRVLNLRQKGAGR
jgi:hypothetical protein